MSAAGPTSASLIELHSSARLHQPAFSRQTYKVHQQIPFMTPSAPSSTGATYGSAPSPSLSSQHSSYDEDIRSQEGDRESKRRRLYEDTSYADHRDSHDDNLVNTPPPSSPLPGSQSFPRMSSTLGHMFGGQGNFLGHSRDLLNIAMSTHTARALLPRIITVVQDLPLPGLQHIIDYLPVASADSSHFMGWREKTDTWPTGGCRYLNRSYTSPR